MPTRPRLIDELEEESRRVRGRTEGEEEQKQAEGEEEEEGEEEDGEESNQETQEQQEAEQEEEGEEGAEEADTQGGAVTTQESPASDEEEIANRRRDAEILRLLGVDGGELRPFQDEAIDNLLEGHDTILRLGSGAGKRLCYQYLSIYCRLYEDRQEKAMAVVINPYIAAIESAVASLPEGFAVGSTAVDWSYNKIQLAATGNWPIVYLTPEKLPNFLASVAAQQPVPPVACFAVEDCHSLTLSRDVLKEKLLLKSDGLLEMPKAEEEEGGEEEEQKEGEEGEDEEEEDEEEVFPLFRPNVEIEVRKVAICMENCGNDRTLSVRNAWREVLDPVVGPNGSGCAIVYVWRRKEDVLWAKQQIKMAYPGLQVAEYSGDGEFLYQEWRAGAGSVKVLIATHASFSTGTRRKDVRVVVTLSPPKSVEQLCQQRNRAGRDGLPAKHLVFWGEWQDVDSMWDLMRFVDGGRAKNKTPRGEGEELAEVGRSLFFHASPSTIPADSFFTALLGEGKWMAKFRLPPSNPYEPDITCRVDSAECPMRALCMYFGIAAPPLDRNCCRHCRQEVETVAVPSTPS